MSVPIEALSISSITNLLASPPQYPRNPTHETHEPLALYIVRVPGSKDVFLTPLKPPTKASISLEAIQTSLYYLHVDTPEDEEVRQSLEAEHANEEQTPRVPILRKPLPSTPFANYPASNPPQTPPKSYPHYQPPDVTAQNDSQASKFASRGSHLRLRAQSDLVSRRPLGARPLPSQRKGDENASPQPALQYTGPDVADTRRQSVPDRKPLSWVPPLEVPSDRQDTNGRRSPTSPLKQVLNDDDDVFSNGITQAPISITLIRRDPTSGTQWNVGNIRVTGRTHNLSLLQPVEIFLDSPGYTKLSRNQPSPHQNLDDLTPSPTSPSSSSGPGFSRRAGFRMLPDGQKPSLQHVRTNSSDVLGELTNGQPKKLRNVYAFTSPWNGTCTFSNGVDGRSLKCRHSLPTQSSVQTDSSVPAAELRFNLPWSLLKPRDLNKHRGTEEDKLPIDQLLRSGRTPKEHWRRSVQTLVQKHRSWTNKAEHATSTDANDYKEQRRSEDSVTTDEEEANRLSLKLGREKAGGGFKGSSAKLGKLVIYDEGLKMGDLVVGACMGIWWQHYLEGI